MIEQGQMTIIDTTTYRCIKIDNEGYDDVYFADDSLKNVNATKKMLRGKNVKWRVQHIKN